MSSDVRFTDFKSHVQPTWCPGCGDYGTMNGLMKALANLGKDPDETFVSTGIGCSGKLGTYLDTYSFHGVHGRALPVAIGAKVANPNLTAIAAGGDGDGYSIGGNHFIHAVRRNVDMTYMVMDNRIYGLTKGQASPTSREELETGTTPQGQEQPPINPLAVALAADATFIAQSFASDAQRHTEILEQAIEHDGFGYVNVLSPCVTFNNLDTYDYYEDAIVDLEDYDHDPTDLNAAEEKILDPDHEYLGVLYRDPDRRSYDARYNLESNMADVPNGAPDGAQQLVDEFY